MFNLDRDGGPRPKCLFTNAQLPTFINYDQPPTKKRPFSVILNQKFTHTLEILLPQDAATPFSPAPLNGIDPLRYLRVYMKLSEIIEGDFFNQYIKSGNILMLSEGRAGIDHVYSLSDGILRLEVDHATFERMGLEGKPIAHDGRKHIKARFAIGLNLRLPSMVRGKKGFERIVWAFKNVLNQSVAWLFYDMNNSSNDGSGPVAIHQPAVRKVEPEVINLENMVVPQFSSELGEDDYIEAMEVLEWLTLAFQDSPRLRADDRIDPYLCRYQVPNWSAEADVPGQLSSTNLVAIRWHGLVTANFALRIFLAGLRASKNGWIAVNASAFDGNTYTSLITNGRSLTWEYND